MKKEKIKVLLVLSLILLTFLSCECLSAKSLFVKEGFHRTGDLIVPRANHTATLLQDGRVLIAGGNHYKPKAPSAEIYDPKTGKFTVTGNMNIPRAWHTATLLNDGRVLIAGGSKLFGSGFLKSSEIYNPKTEKFTLIGDMSKERSHHTATLLKDGNVLIIGGASADIFDFKTNAFHAIQIPDRVRFYDNKTVTLLPNGNILIIGGGRGIKKTDRVELYNSETNKFTTLGHLLEARRMHSSIPLPDGKILVIGGEGNNCHPIKNNPKRNTYALLSVELYNPVSNTSMFIGDMKKLRGDFTATLLFDNNVLIVGGLVEPEIYNSKKNKFCLTKSTLQNRYAHTATLLQDGSVLITGGETSSEFFKNSVRYYSSKKDILNK